MAQYPELYHGPVPPWEPSAQEKERIASMLASDDPLDNAYGQAYSEGFFVREFESHSNGNSSLAAVGEMDAVVLVDFRTGKDLDQNTFTMGECVEIGACPGTGATRHESVLEALKMAREIRRNRLG